ncbi:MAG TPA: CehA/McbA family metallohydrolase [Thermoanaerobaculia bacterium]|nr:CehA/McbA family metallohydrolase [Thermoanaerobaculia bacterium]
MTVARSRGTQGWSAETRLDSGEGTEGGTAMALDREDRPWVVWHGLRAGVWGVFTRRQDGREWTAEQRISDGLHPAIAVDSRGRVWVAWEVPRAHGFEIGIAFFDRGRLSRPARIESPGSDRRPVLAAAPDGSVWIAWDSTRSGNFDIWVARAQAGSGAPAIDAPMAATSDGRVDDSPSLACARDGSLWLAWNSMRSHGSEPLRVDRHSGDAFVRVYRQGRWWSPPGVVPGALPGQVSYGLLNKTPNDAVPAYWKWKQTQNYPRVFLDARDRAWIIWRTDATGAHNFDLWGRVHDGERWSPELHLTDFSPGRDEWPVAAARPDGSLELAWEGQILPRPGEEEALGGGDVDSYNTLGNPNVVLVGRATVPAEGAEGWSPAPLSPAPEEVLGDTDEPMLPGPPPRTVKTRDGRWQIFFGDPHTHSILSDGKTGLPDQLLVLSRDHLGLDFAVVSDHAEMGRLQPTEFAEVRSTASTFDQPGRFVSLSGWEWTAGVLYGHRVILHRDDGGPHLSAMSPEGDTIEELHAHLHRTGGVMSPHHTGHATWGRWNPDASHDEELEPNFEISSWHGRYEFYGNPFEGRRQIPGHQYQDALRRGRHVGVMGASDTHHLTPGEGGVTAILAERLDRGSLFDAIRARRNYATSGARIVLDFTIDGEPMGSKIQADDRIDLSVYVEGTAAIDRVEIVRDLVDTFAVIRLEQVAGTSRGAVYVYDPGDPQGGKRVPTEDLSRLEIKFEDAVKPSGETAYYVRVTQVDGHQAWSSPIWVSRQR